MSHSTCSCFTEGLLHGAIYATIAILVLATMIGLSRRFLENYPCTKND